MCLTEYILPLRVLVVQKTIAASRVKQITVDNTTPTVTLIAPADLATFFLIHP